jgi:predicted DNA-binding transcriptional regulator YafY
MRRADRLFQIIQSLRGRRRPATAERLANELEVSVRTVYRDIGELIGRNVPIRGEAGIGYVLDASYDMPPLMLTPDELEAAVLGAQWVLARGDPALRRGAQNLISKIEGVVPKQLRPVIVDASLIYPGTSAPEKDTVDMEGVRRAIRDWRKMRLHYVDERGSASERLIWPIAVAYFESARLIAAWCELRGGFRHFRSDRVQRAEFLDERIPKSKGSLLKEWHESESSNEHRQARSGGR